MNDDLIRLAVALDSENMIDLTRNFVDDLEDGLEIMQRDLHSWLPMLKSKEWSGVLCLGMGGSAAGGDFLSTICDTASSVPVCVTRDYTLPSWWNSSWLVLATSYSGNTEETISAVEHAAKLGGSIVVISSGGVLAGFADFYDNVHLISVPSGQPPRTAFGHLFSRQLGLFIGLGLLPEIINKEMLERLREVKDLFDIIADPSGNIPSLALSLMEREIAILGPSELKPALVRMKNQLNENSARFARISVVPEMNHNEIVAWGGVGNDQDERASSQGLLIITWDGIHDRVRQRMDWFVANSPTETVWRIHADGDSLVEALLHLCISMDWLSIALAFLHGKDPSSIKTIVALKDHLDNIS